jgi:hypothetical protein
LHTVVPPGQTHFPPLQSSLDVHWMPHAPQLFGSCFSLTQELLQSERPPGQFATHIPALQTSPAAHALPHAPQLFTSVCSLTQAPLQSDCPAGQTHAPVTQAAVAGQAVAHPPQLSGSICSFTHDVPHWVSVAGHIVRHVPPEHSEPVMQGDPQAPQFAASVVTSVQVPPQFARPTSQPHVPARQT